LNGFGDGGGGRKGNEDVNVIRNAANGEWFDVVLGGDSAEIGP